MVASSIHVKTTAKPLPVSYKRIVDRPILTTRNLTLLLLVSSVFLLSNSVRHGISSLLANVDIFFYLAAFILVIRYRGRTRFCEFSLWLLTVVTVLVTNSIAGAEMHDTVWALVMYCLPVLVGMLHFEGNLDCSQSARTIIRIINFYVCCVFGILLLDLLTGSAVMGFISSTMLKDLSGWISTGRRLSIWGHYLTTAIFYLAFYYLNVAYKAFKGSYLMPVWIIYLISALGIASTGGKTAIVVYIISVFCVISLSEKHRLRNSAAFMALLLIFYFAGAFDIVIERFGSEDPSGGRNAGVAAMMSTDPLQLFSSYGETFTQYSTSAVGSFLGIVVMEYSPIGLAYKYGIIWLFGVFCGWIF